MKTANLPQNFTQSILCKISWNPCKSLNLCIVICYTSYMLHYKWTPCVGKSTLVVSMVISWLVLLIDSWLLALCWCAGAEKHIYFLKV